MFEQLKNLDPRKGSPQKSLPPKILKTNADLFCFPLVDLFNRQIEEGSVPNDLKYADVSSLFKKGDNMCKKNYRPISLLPASSKLSERLIYNQLYDYMGQFCSLLLGGFRQNYSTQHVSLDLLPHCRNIIGNKGHARALFTDLSKAFGSVHHDLLVAKVNDYGINLYAFQLKGSYIFKRQQRVKLNNIFSDWKRD